MFSTVSVNGWSICPGDIKIIQKRDDVPYFDGISATLFRTLLDLDWTNIGLSIDVNESNRSFTFRKRNKQSNPQKSSEGIIIIIDISEKSSTTHISTHVFEHIQQILYEKLREIVATFKKGIYHHRTIRPVLDMPYVSRICYCFFSFHLYVHSTRFFSFGVSKKSRCK